MRMNLLWVMFLSLIVGGCANDGKTVSSDVSSSMSSRGAEGPTPTTSSTVVAESTPSTSSAATTGSSSMNQDTSTKRARIAAGVDEETLETCLDRIPKDATTGQRMLAEQTCRRDFATRR